MKVEKIKDYICQGREIEFTYNNKRYSITYGEINGEDVISFCEFYKESTEAKSINELMQIKQDNITVEEMINCISENDIDVY